MFVYTRTDTPLKMEKGAAYYRVSTDRQGDSGLGLEAQMNAVHYFVQSKRYDLTREFTEVESGKKNKRLILKEALDYCLKNHATLIIAKLDRLSRNVAFIASLMESRVQFVAVDIPGASHLVLHVMAAFAQYEREQISKRTKEALQAAKEKGIQLGANGRALSKLNRQRSEEFASKHMLLITDLKNTGFKTIQSIADELNKRNIPTFRPGCRWHKSTVHALISTQGKLVSNVETRGTTGKI